MLIRSENKYLWALVLILLLASMLMFPLGLGSSRFEHLPASWSFVFGTLLMAVLLAAIRQVSQAHRWLAPLFWTLLALAYLVRIIWQLALDFSGEGFTSNFYVHASPQALQLGLKEYAGSLALALLAFAMVAYLLVRLGKKPLLFKWSHSVVLVPVLLGLLWYSPAYSPEQELLRNFMAFSAASNPGTLNKQEIRIFRNTGLVHLDDNEKSRIVAAAATPPRNLILVYLESFQLAFTELGPFKDLTPNLNRLMREHGYHANWLSSADATMEAIISTQCGTLVSSPQGSSTFANTKAIVPRLACLPDVLHAAGYRQVYLGGFDKSFSGKEKFLSGHGYDEVVGWEDWQKKGFKNRDHYWGLDDDQLFEQALIRIEELAAAPDKQPFNLTLLTLSTHPPFFSSSNCTPYSANPDDTILEAIHCTDELLGKFVERLKSSGVLANSTLVLVGDHDIFNLPEVKAYFPELSTDPRLLLIIIDPEQRFDYAQQVNIAYDLAPTLLDILGVQTNTQFVWGNSVFDPQEYHVTRNFRGKDATKLEFMTAGSRECGAANETLLPPLNDCQHTQLLRLSDKYLYGFYGQEPVPAVLCDEENELRVTVDAGESPVSMHILGNDVSDSFAYNGRPLNPSEPGFYLYIKASTSRAAGFYYFSLEHEYYQMKLVEALLELDADNQIVLAYKPHGDVQIIEPLKRLLRDYGFKRPDLKQAFVIATNGDPAKGQVFVQRGMNHTALELDSVQCRQLAQMDQPRTVVERGAIAKLLLPYQKAFPDP